LATSGGTAFSDRDPHPLPQNQRNSGHGERNPLPSATEAYYEIKSRANDYIGCGKFNAQNSEILANHDSPPASPAALLKLSNNAG